MSEKPNLLVLPTKFQRDYLDPYNYARWIAILFADRKMPVPIRVNARLLTSELLNTRFLERSPRAKMGSH